MRPEWAGARIIATIAPHATQRDLHFSTVSTKLPALRCDLFCRVIDNYGDIGVTWRLARALVSELAWQVRVFCDDFAAFERLCPHNTTPVQVLPWPINPVAVADLVIEMFGCELPEIYLQQMTEVSSAPLWLNLEYLSAENWVDEFHLKTSPHPRLPLTKHFFFPGFSAASGGLVIERDTLARWQPYSTPASNVQTVLLFCYDNPALASLLHAWQNSGQTFRVLVAPGPTLQQLRQLKQLPRIQIEAIDFVAQDQFDALLAQCDWLFVRGEDSFVRAQLAARPFLWQVYPQDEQMHLKKLAAFEEKFLADCPPEVAHAWRVFSQAWNRGENVQHLWPALAAQHAALTQHGEAWRKKLIAQKSLVAHLNRFVWARLNAH